MKCIAKISDGKWLFEVSDHEIAKLIAENSGYPGERTKAVSVGREVQVSELWNALQTIRAHHTDIGGLADKLRDLATKLDKTKQTVVNPVIVHTEAKG
jgi:hypothetical protein